MATYEITAIVRGDDDVAAVSGALAGVGATITNETQLGQRRLAYPIKKVSAAVYSVYQFEAEPTAITELNQKLLGQDGVLRHLIIAGGIRAGAPAAGKKLSAKDLEVPESLTKGMAELAKAATEAPRETGDRRQSPPGRDPAEAGETGDEVTEKPALEPKADEAAAKPEKTTAKAPKAGARRAEPLGGAEESTADERQKKLDEKLKSILGE